MSVIRYRRNLIGHYQIVSGERGCLVFRGQAEELAREFGGFVLELLDPSGTKTLYVATNPMRDLAVVPDLLGTAMCIS